MRLTIAKEIEKRVARFGFGRVRAMRCTDNASTLNQICTREAVAPRKQKMLKHGRLGWPIGRNSQPDRPPDLGATTGSPRWRREAARARVA